MVSEDTSLYIPIELIPPLGTYLKTLAFLESDVHTVSSLRSSEKCLLLSSGVQLRSDAKEAFATLNELRQRLTEKREQAISTVTKKIDNKIVLQVSDTWEALGIGWKTQEEVARAVSITTLWVSLSICSPLYLTSANA